MKDYKKYKWFYTSSGKLVVGGKSAEQNDELMRKIVKSGKEYYVMHTALPGSPFCVIIADIAKINNKDQEECAIFTGCFSRAWKQQKKFTKVDIFRASQLEKIKGMKTGTWKVMGKVKRVKVNLKLVLVKQKGVYRAVPEKSARKKDIVLKVCPGNVNKEKMIDELKKEIKDEKVKTDELLSALPAGGVRFC